MNTFCIACGMAVTTVQILLSCYQTEYDMASARKISPFTKESDELSREKGWPILVSRNYLTIVPFGRRNLENLPLAAEDWHWSLESAHALNRCVLLSLFGIP